MRRTFSCAETLIRSRGAIATRVPDVSHVLAVWFRCHFRVVVHVEEVSNDGTDLLQYTETRSCANPIHIHQTVLVTITVKAANCFSSNILCAHNTGKGTHPKRRSELKAFREAHIRVEERQTVLARQPESAEIGRNFNASSSRNFPTYPAISEKSEKAFRIAGMRFVSLLGS